MTLNLLTGYMEMFGKLLRPGAIFFNFKMHKKRLEKPAGELTALHKVSWLNFSRLLHGKEEQERGAG